MGRAIVLGIVFTWCALGSREAAAQDFILLGCYWDCPDDAAAEIDPAALTFWVDKVRGQAPALRHSGFSYLWLPGFYPGQQRQIGGLISALRAAGIEAVIDVDLTLTADAPDSLRYTLEQIRQLRRELQVRSYRLTAGREISPATVSNMLDRLSSAGELPQLLAIRTQEKQSAVRLAGFVNAVEGQTAAAAELDTRVFDYPLREALRRACVNPRYDVRQVFSSSIRDVTSLSGFKMVTLINSPEFYNPNGITGDADDLIDDPLLAYAYILTNNQLGLPAIFYGDYYGPESEIEFFLNKQALQEEIDQLIKAHQTYIFNATSVEYLNRPDTDRRARYLSGAASRALIYQLDGGNTPAGQAAAGQGRDVLVAINFADTTLRLVQEINMSNVTPGDRFTDVFGHSNQAFTTVGSLTEHDILNAVYLELPPRSYSLWVQGRVEKVLPGPIDFSASWLDQYVELNWAAPTEAGIRGYQLERSVNGKPYQALTWIDAAGKGPESASYLFVDENVFPNETLYYRVKVVSGPERFEYTPVKEVSIPAEEWEFDVLNERDAVKTVRIRSTFADEVALSVFNAGGRRVRQSLLGLKRGVNQIRVDLSGLPKGVYFIHFSGSRDKRWTQRVVNW